MGSHVRGARVETALAAVLATGFAVVLSPAPTQAQDAYNRGGATAPDGLWVAGGLYAASSAGTGVRMELGVPLGVVGPGLMSVAVPVNTWHNGIGCISREICRRWRTNALYVLPELQWEYVLPIRMKHRLSVVPFAGAGFGMFWTYVDDYDRLGTLREVSLGMGVRTGAAVRFGFLNGVFVQVQPVGLLFNVPFDGQPVPGAGEFVYGRSFWVSYDAYFMVGYRFD